MVTSRDDMAAELGRHWGAVFNTTAVSPDQADSVLAAHMPVFPKTRWTLTEDEFRKMLSQCKDSAPGPDGIVYSCWRSGPPWVAASLYTCFCSWLDGAPLPYDFNFSFLALLPKVDKGVVSAGETRPLSLGNTDSKLFAGGLQCMIAPGLPRFISLEQSGFMPGRSILGNLLNVDVAMKRTAMTSSSGGACFFDFAAAFPSLNHQFLWKALSSAGFPASIVACIQSLYR